MKLMNSIKALSESLIKAWNSHDFTQVAPYYSPDYEGFDVAQATPQTGIAGIQAGLAGYWKAFPDLHFTLKESVCEGNQITLYWIATGTHQGPILNIPATGRPVYIEGVALHHIRDGKVVRCHYIWDTAGLLRNLGLLPALAA
jgi:steroid delta-isomerase-like uncharacterized protein